MGSMDMFLLAMPIAVAYMIFVEPVIILKQKCEKAIGDYKEKREKRLEEDRIHRYSPPQKN